MSEWKKGQLGSILNFRRGHDLPKEKMSNYGYVVAGSNGVIGKHDEYTTEKPCITIGRSGNTGTPFFYNEKCWAHNTVLYIDNYKGNNPKYIFYLLKSLDLKKYSSGSAVPTLNRNFIHPIEIIYTSDIDAQKSIAKVLSSFDEKIENCNKIIANLNAQIEAIFKNWFVDFAPFADNLSEEGIPTGWRNSNVFDESEEVSERNKDDLEYPVLSVVKDGEFVLSEDRFTKQVYSKEQTKYKIVSRNQIGFNPARANIGSIAMLTNFDKGLVSPIYVVFKLKDSILPTYFYYYMKRPVFLQNIQAQAIGTTRQNLSYDAFKLFPMIVPPTDIQQKFIELIAPMEQEIANQKKQIEKLANTRDTLLPKLMSGEIEVPVEE